MPERPEAMDHDDLDGAEAAGIFFVELYAYSFATGDVGPLEQISDSACRYCQDLIVDVLELYDSGGYATTEPFRFDDYGAQIYSGVEGDYVFEGIVEAAPMLTYNSDGTVIHESDWTPVRMWVLLTHVEEGWTVNGARGEGVEA